ncbi:PL29 family lyase N-terminal domain-containing protein [Bacteroides sp. L008]|uniref:PL29 family lyase N-terminal domain-containing protein n=1 Tax=Bacteroides sp. L008 TaxID=3162404 RepID=UPI0034667C65
MKRKFVKVMFFGALALSTVTYVGCKDYDDDIDNLQTQIDANKASIAELQNFVKEGKWVTAVEPITDGFKITFNDGKSYSIVSGAAGASGTKIEIDPTTKNWIIDGKDSGICSEGQKGDKGDDGEPGKGEPGKDGEDGYAPQISENGNWIVWDVASQKPVETDIKAASDIYVTADPNNSLVWVLNVFNKETKEWEKVSMPKAARITSMSVLGVKADGTVNLGSTEAEATLYYGVAGEDIEFNGNKTFKKEGDLLVTRGGSMIHALINPVNLKAADIQAYEIGLTDSKGNTNFIVASIGDNFSENALTRAAEEPEATANKGIYDLTLKFADGVDDETLNSFDSKTAYALTTKDAWGNEIISQYGVKVDVQTSEPTVEFVDPEPLPFKVTYNLDELAGSGLDNVVAYYYEVKDEDAKNVDATFDEEKNTILANKEGTLLVTIHYLTTKGAKKEYKMNLKFTYVAKQAEIKDMTWVVDGKKLTAESDIVGPSVDEIRKSISDIYYEIEYAGGKVTINGKENLAYADNENTRESIELSLVGLNAKGEDVEKLNDETITKYVIRATFNENYVAAVPHTATVKFINNDGNADLGNQYLYETTFTITVDQQDAKLFVFKRAGAYFKGDDATAYGKVAATAQTKTISYNLYSLYQANSILVGDETANSFVTFTEEIPKDEANKKEGKAWLSAKETSNGDISVEPSPAYGGAYMGRNITVTYAPFGNSRLNAIVDEFNLTIKSEIFEGNFEYAKKIDDKVIGTKDNPFEVDGGRSIDILESEFKKEDVYGATYDFDNDRINKVEVVLADDNAKTYLTAATSFADVTEGEEVLDRKVTISKNPSATGIVTPPVCKVDVKITDKWGKTKTTSIYVEVIK